MRADTCRATVPLARRIPDLEAEARVAVRATPPAFSRLMLRTASRVWKAASSAPPLALAKL